MAGQIVALADFFDTLTRRRPYRAAYAIEEALNEVKRRAGTEFNPMLVTTFMRSLTEARQRLQDKARSPKEFRMQGSVDTDTLFDLLLSLVHNRKSGRLGLYLGFSEALLYVHEGQVIHAEYEGESGEAAVAKLVVQAQRYVQMDFVLEPWEFDGDVDVAIELPLQRLLLSSAVAVDEQLATNLIDPHSNTASGALDPAACGCFDGMTLAPGRGVASCTRPNRPSPLVRCPPTTA